MANTISWGQLSWSAGSWGLQDLQDGWGRLTWGENEWGVTDAISVSVTGQSLTTSLNSVTALGTAVVDLTGQSLTISLNSVTALANANIDVTGQQLSTSLNSVTAIGTAVVDLIGQQLNISEGEVDVSPDANVTGQQLILSQNYLNYHHPKIYIQNL